ncbi:MAG TPA: class I SAM-dependent RNA methyltransferase [Burkholderiales bacterium]|nr:class I SAM-dependent RNA methyltransferase [Burkholderiales bacterium]
MSSSRSENFFATCPRGLEALLVQELAALDIAATSVPGGVAFAGHWDACYRANLWSRVASRILWRVAQFDYRNEHELYAAVQKIDWPRHFRVERTLRVNVTAQKSPLKSLEFATLRIKDAVCDRFRDALGKRPSIDRANPDVRVHAFLEAERASVYLDTSGEPLFKRGWRGATGEAPLRENLAAGIIMLTGWQPDQVLLDPMCGGATFLTEAAAMARGRAPGAKRSFGFEKLAAFEAKAWDRVKGEPRGKELAPRLHGSDTDPKALSASRRNLAEAGVERWVKLEQADVLERGAPADSGVMVMNPPYGERMGSAEELARFYPKLGDALKQRFAGWRCYIFTADLRAAKLVRLTPSKRIPLWNGALECRLYEFDVVAGSHRKKSAPA